ncbi:MAG TPA: transglutaminase domain-containing protein, partial [Nevskiaceae bacterium]|nr:transglutaminase domain-containing protein [Nevskiaceae bacterium]
PMRTRWMFLLDAPNPRRLPPASMLSATGSVLARDTVRERKLYEAESDLRYVMEPDLSDRNRVRGLQLPAGFNPRATAMAQEWRAAGLADTAIVDRSLEFFHGQPFRYTLSPPALGRDSIDQFLFGTRRGFCEHYASAFTFLMRSAGVPARVVTGYLGGQYNELGDYYLVSQADAHAWSEVWIQGRGWVRIDPTSAVAPGRVEAGLTGAVAVTEGLADGLRNRVSWRLYLEIRWDWVNAKWNEWILGYGPELQKTFLSFFGMADLTRMLLGLTAAVSILLVVVGAATMRRSGPPPITERSLELWRAAGRRLHAIGFDQRPDEGPRDFAHRVAEAEPGLADTMRGILDAYLRLRYAGEHNPALEQSFAEAVRRIRRP